MEDVYYEDYLKKECAKGKWQRYWVRLLGTGLFFYDSERACTEREASIEVINITTNTKCVPARRQTYSFRFLLLTGNKSYKLKCETPIDRYRWIYMIGLAANGKPIEEPPHFIPAAFYRNQNSDKIPEKYHGASKIEAQQENIGSEESRGSLRRSIAFFRRLSSRRKKNPEVEVVPPHQTTLILVASNNNSHGNGNFERQEKDANVRLNFAENLAYSGD